jgi:hypothetical protein
MMKSLRPSRRTNPSAYSLVGHRRRQGAGCRLIVHVAAPSHVCSIRGIVLRGVCLMRREEVDWMYRGGAGALHPKAWLDFLGHLTPEERSDPLPAYHARLTSGSRAVSDAAVRSRGARRAHMSLGGTTEGLADRRMRCLKASMFSFHLSVRTNLNLGYAFLRRTVLEGVLACVAGLQRPCVYPSVCLPACSAAARFRWLAGAVRWLKRPCECARPRPFPGGGVDAVGDGGGLHAHEQPAGLGRTGLGAEAAPVAVAAAAAGGRRAAVRRRRPEWDDDLWSRHALSERQQHRRSRRQRGSGVRQRRSCGARSANRAGCKRIRGRQTDRQAPGARRRGAAGLQARRGRRGAKRSGRSSSAVDAGRGGLGGRRAGVAGMPLQRERRLPGGGAAAGGVLLASTRDGAVWEEQLLG